MPLRLDDALDPLSVCVEHSSRSRADSEGAPQGRWEGSVDDFTLCTLVDVGTPVPGNRSTGGIYWRDGGAVQRRCSWDSVTSIKRELRK
jgi:hypothetical protein